MAMWKELLTVLQAHVTKGTVTTYGQISRYFYPEEPMKNLPVTSMLRAMTEHGHEAITRRVVNADGTLQAGRPQGAVAQERTLRQEGVAFAAKGIVNMKVCPAVVLPHRAVESSLAQRGKEPI